MSSVLICNLLITRADRVTCLSRFFPACSNTTNQASPDCPSAIPTGPTGEPELPSSGSEAWSTARSHSVSTATSRMGTRRSPSTAITLPWPTTPWATVNTSCPPSLVGSDTTVPTVRVGFRLQPTPSRRNTASTGGCDNGSSDTTRHTAATVTVATATSATSAVRNLTTRRALSSGDISSFSLLFAIVPRQSPIDTNWRLQ